MRQIRADVADVTRDLPATRGRVALIPLTLDGHSLPQLCIASEADVLLFDTGSTEWRSIGNGLPNGERLSAIAPLTWHANADAKLVAATGRTVSLWDARTGRWNAAFSAPEAVTAICSVPNQRQLQIAWGCASGLFIWSQMTGTSRREGGAPDTSGLVPIGSNVTVLRPLRNGVSDNILVCSQARVHLLNAAGSELTELCQLAGAAVDQRVYSTDTYASKVLLAGSFLSYGIKGSWQTANRILQWRPGKPIASPGFGCDGKVLAVTAIDDTRTLVAGENVFGAGVSIAVHNGKCWQKLANCTNPLPARAACRAGRTVYVLQDRNEGPGMSTDIWEIHQC